MFNKNTNTKTKSEPVATISAGQKESGINCLISKGTKIEGKFKSAENLRLDGKIVGEVHCEKKLVMGKGSLIEGSIIAAEAVILGHVVGDMTIHGVLHLHTSAKIKGNIHAKSLKVEEGAVYDGECKVGGVK